jgi:hypothetical protein
MTWNHPEISSGLKMPCQYPNQHNSLKIKENNEKVAQKMGIF